MPRDEGRRSNLFEPTHPQTMGAEADPALRSRNASTRKHTVIRHIVVNFHRDSLTGGLDTEHLLHLCNTYACE